MCRLVWVDAGVIPPLQSLLGRPPPAVSPPPSVIPVTRRTLSITDAPSADTDGTTPSNPTTAETAAPASAAGDVLPLAISHNSTRLQLPAAGGRLTYRTAGRPPVTVPEAERRDQVTVSDLLPGTGYVFTWIGASGNRKLRVDTKRESRGRDGVGGGQWRRGCYRWGGR